MNQQLQTIDPDTGEITETGPFGAAHEQTLAISLARAEIDQQIATARALPRQIKRVANNIYSLATLDDQTAAECVYVLPRGGKQLRGPSIRLAEIIANQWGNCRVGARVVHIDKFEKYIEAEGVFHDLETNTATTARVRRRISDKNGRLFNDDMIVVTGNAACSIAKRNAILGGIPKAVWRHAFGAVEAVLAGDEKPLVEVRDMTLKAFAAKGIGPERICARLEINSPEEITRDHIVDLRALFASIRDGEITPEDAFPEIEADEKDEAVGKKKADKAKSGGKGIAGKMDEIAGDDRDAGNKAGANAGAPAKGAPDEGAAPKSADGGGNSSRPKPSAGTGDANPVDEAERAGVSAARKGIARAAIPPAYSNDDALKAAWLAGYDSEQEG